MLEKIIKKYIHSYALQVSKLKQKQLEINEIYFNIPIKILTNRLLDIIKKITSS